MSMVSGEGVEGLEQLPKHCYTKVPESTYDDVNRPLSGKEYFVMVRTTRPSNACSSWYLKNASLHVSNCQLFAIA